MKVYEAIEKMRAMSAREEEFSFSFMSYSITRDTSEGEVFVEHALLLKNSKESTNSYQEYMLRYLNTDTGKEHHCWIPLLMSFQHEPLEGIE